MSISATSGSGPGWAMGSAQRKPPELTKDQLTTLDQKLKSEGKDTSNLDKIISSFDQLDTDKNGSVSMDELKTGAAANGINLPKGGGGGHHHHKKVDNDGDEGSGPPSAPPNGWGPPPGLLSNSTSSSSSSSTSSSSDANSFMLSLLEKFAGSNPTTSQASSASSSSVNVAA